MTIDWRGSVAMRIALGMTVVVAILAAALVALHRSLDLPALPASLPGEAKPLAPPPPSPWTAGQLAALVEAVQGAAAEGLNPADYDPDTLRAAAARQRTGPVIDLVADAAALTLAHDYAAGRIRNRHRFNWYIDRTGPDDAALRQGIGAARGDGRLAAWLRGLLPTAPSYLALRAALADARAGPTRDRIRVNMERWRWLPRDFGRGDRLYVNIPTYRLEVIRDGVTAETYKVVVGASDTPTPSLTAPVRQVIANPSWIVPLSIVRTSHLRPSAKYSFTTLPNGTVRVRQKPGPGNALGRVKIEFPNTMAIYFHDTPAKSLFARDVRPFSHGCIRVQGVEALASTVVDGNPRLAQAFAQAETRSVSVAHPWRAEIVYLTMVTDDGTPVALGDPYALDPAMAAALDGKRYTVPDRAPPRGP